MSKVLLIDDAEDFHGLVRAELAIDGIELFSALEGASGIAAAKHVKPDLILLDVRLPGMDGFEVCELLSVQAETASIPIVFLSASSSPEDRARGLNQGATDFISKPFYGEELRARVRVSMRYKALLEIEARRAMRDGMTGLWNRLYFDERLEGESAASERHGRPLACLMLDLDHFKAINDTHGHATGDQALRAVGSLLIEQCRTEDVVCRYGGEEFIVLCPSTSAKDALVLADRLRAAIETVNVCGTYGRLSLTCSIGVADGMVGEELVRSADAALYRAKHEGRNRVCQFKPIPAVAAVEAAAVHRAA